MSLPLIKRAPTTPTQWQDFHWAHYVEHKVILGVVQKNSATTLLMPPIWPIRNFSERIAKWHQDLHTQMNQLSGAAGIDMSRADLSSQEGREDFVNTNYREHLIFHQVIGVPT